LETAKGQIQRFVSKYSPKKIWADPSRADLIRQMELWGFNITKANNDILGGIMAVSHYLKVKSDGKPKLFVHPDCKNLIAEFQMYRYNDKKKGEKPLDKYNHCFVAGTEIATRRGEIPIEDVTVYDEVLTRRGYRKVLRSWMVSDSARVCKFPFGVTCTPEHKIYDSDSNLFIEASAYSNDKHPLMLGDILCTKQSLSDIMDSHIDDTLQWVGQMPSILNESHPREYPNTYIGEYGKTPMEPSPANIISTTKMGTHQITQSKILSAYMAQNTYPPIQRSGRAITKKPSKSIWKGYDHSPKNGTVLPKDLSGTEYTVERCGRTLLLSSASVTNAGRSSMIYRTIVNSALTNASLHGEGTLDSMTHREHVMFAGNHLSSIDTVRQRPAQEVVRESIEPVYDLTIEGVSEYYANGILVHNCLDALRYGVNLPNDVPRNSDRFKNIVGIKRRWKY
jgi:hypothetical protein